MPAGEVRFRQGFLRHFARAASRHGGSGLAQPFGVLASLEPASAGLAGVLVLGQHLRALQWVALACVGLAIARAVLGRKDATQRIG